MSDLMAFARLTLCDGRQHLLRVDRIVSVIERPPELGEEHAGSTIVTMDGAAWDVRQSQAETSEAITEAIRVLKSYAT
jgi:hypothetical protein